MLSGRMSKNLIGITAVKYLPQRGEVSPLQGKEDAPQRSNKVFSGLLTVGGAVKAVIEAAGLTQVDDRVNL